jgi:hypothetical protein
MFSARVAFSQQFLGFGAAGQQLEPENAAAGDLPADAFYESTSPVKTRLRSTAQTQDSPARKRPQRWTLRPFRNVVPQATV